MLHVHACALRVRTLDLQPLQACASRNSYLHPPPTHTHRPQACSTVRVQLDSKPESIDSLERQGTRLRVEREALRKEKDPLSAARLEEVEKELAALEDKLRPLLVSGVGQQLCFGSVGLVLRARICCASSRTAARADCFMR